MMKMWLIAVLLVAALAVGAGGMALAQQASDTPSTTLPGNVSVSIPNQQVGIWVNGTGEVMVVPDLATIQLGIEAQATKVSDAQSQASSAMNKVIAALKAQGVADKDIQTRYFNITQVTKWDQNGQTQIVIGYRVSNSVIAKIRDIGKAGMIIDVVAEAGGDLTRINGISFSLDNETNALREARDKAMADAQAKAQQLADKGGVKLGAATFISENSVTPYRQISAPMALDSKAAGESTPISAGELEISVSVQVTYAIK